MSVTFVSANGTTWDLDGSSGVTLLADTEGFFEEPISLLIEQRVGADGGVLLESRRPQRPMIWRLLLTGSTVLATWSQFKRALAVGGTVIYDGPNGLRELRNIVLEAPDRSMLGYDLGAIAADTMSVAVTALDPWWYGTAISQDITIAPPTAWNAAIPWDSVIPWDGGGSFGVNVQGDGPAWPYWTLHGEVTTLTVSVVDAGSWIWESTLDASTYGTVDHRPGSRSPRLGSELNGVAESAFGLWGLVDESSSLDWGLGPGDMSVIVGVTGDGGSTSLALWYEPRYLTP